MHERVIIINVHDDGSAYAKEALSDGWNVWTITPRGRSSQAWRRAGGLRIVGDLSHDHATPKVFAALADPATRIDGDRVSLAQWDVEEWIEEFGGER